VSKGASMMLIRRTLMALGTTLLVAPLLVTGGGSTAHTAAEPAARRHHPHVQAAETAVAWQRVAIRTIYTEGALPPPAGSLYLTFTSQAVHAAARHASHYGRTASTAAVATAAHDVLHEYFPASRVALDADLATSMAGLQDGWRKGVGVRIGARAADEMIASRIDDGRGDTSIVYSKPALPGYWQPPATGMALPWLGFVDPVIDVPPVELDGPDPLRSREYTEEFHEVRKLGSTTSTMRTAEQTATALFFGVNPIVMYRDALCRYLDTHPLSLLDTTRMFARIDTANSMSFIQAWQLKFDLGFWRPSEAIAGADNDGNWHTRAEAGWIPLIANPAYADYTSGHAAATSPFAQVVRMTLGDDVALALRNGAVERTYTSLSALEHDALEARIWAGLHFRDAMEDGYYMGHVTAYRVMRALW
jgi:hypothetical protein